MKKKRIEKKSLNAFQIEKTFPLFIFVLFSYNKVYLLIKFNFNLFTIMGTFEFYNHLLGCTCACVVDNHCSAWTFNTFKLTALFRCLAIEFSGQN